MQCNCCSTLNYIKATTKLSYIRELAVMGGQPNLQRETMQKTIFKISKMDSKHILESFNFFNPSIVACLY